MDRNDKREQDFMAGMKKRDLEVVGFGEPIVTSGVDFTFMGLGPSPKGGNKEVPDSGAEQTIPGDDEQSENNPSGRS